MRVHLIPLFSFLIFCAIILYLTTHTSFSKISSPFFFITHLVSPMRVRLYSAAHAEGAPSVFDKLKTENKQLTEKLVQLNAIKKDNEALRSQFQDTNISSEKLIPGHIVGFKGSISSPDTFILDVGEKSGVKNGMAAVVGNNLVGKVTKITPYFSELILVINKNFSILAQTSEENSPGIINGEEDFILFEKIVITDTILKNDTVVTKGGENTQGIGIPPNFIIGKITGVNKSETSPFQSAIVKSLLNFSKLNIVFIVTQ